jgi:hypothetical protein
MQSLELWGTSAPCLMQQERQCPTKPSTQLRLDRSHSYILFSLSQFDTSICLHHRFRVWHMFKGTDGERVRDSSKTQATISINVSVRSGSITEDEIDTAKAERVTDLSPPFLGCVT